MHSYTIVFFIHYVCHFPFRVGRSAKVINTSAIIKVLLFGLPAMVSLRVALCHFKILACLCFKFIFTTFLSHIEFLISLFYMHLLSMLFAHINGAVITLIISHSTPTQKTITYNNAVNTYS